jgi:hypothetical protein
MTIELTPKELSVLRECVRIAGEDGSIETYDPSGKVVAAIIKKLEAAAPVSRS